MASVFKFAAQGTITDDKYLTIAGAVGSVCNGSSRVIWASFQDKYGFKKVYLVLLIVQLIISSALWSCRFNPILYILGVGIAFLCEGGHFSMFPTACVNIFGIVNGGFVYSMMYCFIPLSALVSFGIV